MERPSIEILRERCVGCGLCVKACPFGAIVVRDRKAEIDYATCTLCGACVSACAKYGAIADRRKAQEETQHRGKQEGEVWVFVECGKNGLIPVTCELLGCAADLARERASTVGAVLVGANAAAFADEAAWYGADTVYVADHRELEHYRDEPYARVLAGAVKQYQPGVLLGGATAVGRALLPRVAVMVHTGLTADCTELAIDPKTGLLRQTRPAFGGNILATIVCRRHRPQMATVRPGVLPRPQPDRSRTARVVSLPVNESELESGLVWRGFDAQAEGGIDLHEADVIVTAGLGTGGPEGVERVRELAAALDAALGATRAVIDAGWLTYEHQIGQTGTTVQPDLYIACGVSGAIQHRVGMQNSATIVAINRDPDAPIFEVADYAVIGDVQDILPELIHQLQAAKSE